MEDIIKHIEHLLLKNALAYVLSQESVNGAHIPIMAFVNYSMKSKKLTTRYAHCVWIMKEIVCHVSIIKIHNFCSLIYTHKICCTQNKKTNKIYYSYDCIHNNTNNNSYNSWRYIETDQKLGYYSKDPQFWSNYLKLGQNEQLMSWQNCLNNSLFG